MDKVQELIESQDISGLKEELCAYVSGKNAVCKQSTSAVFVSLLQNFDDETQNLTCKAIAELAKTEANRELLTNANLIAELLKIIKQKQHKSDAVHNAMRALGNICYENFKACGIAGKDALQAIVNLAENYRNNDANFNVTFCGLLTNLLNSDDNLQNAAAELNMQSVVWKLLKVNLETEINVPVVTHLLNVLNVLVEPTEDDQNTKLFETVIKIMQKCADPEIRALCLELFHNNSENKHIKVLLAKEGICQLIFDLVEQYGSCVSDEESRGLLKMACDLIVVILTEDECMEMLYDHGKGTVYKNMLLWLDSEDIDLVSTGTLAIGNFARNDSHCIQMVEMNTARKLLELLAKHNSSQGDVKIQHAVLSTLRNLAIPQKNKSILLEEKLVEIAYPLTKYDQDIVIFKLLGTYRMVIDGQEKAAAQMLSRIEFMRRLVHWCYNCDHLGIRGEVPRLIAWLIKHSHSFDPFPPLLDVPDLVKCLVEMISSNHAVMQNEALYALNLLLLGYKGKDRERFVQQLVGADVGKHFLFILNKYGDRMDQKTEENIVKVLDKMLECEAILGHLKNSGLQGALENLKGNSSVAPNDIERVLDLIRLQI